MEGGGGCFSGRKPKSVSNNKSITYDMILKPINLITFCFVSEKLHKTFSNARVIEPNAVCLYI